MDDQEYFTQDMRYDLEEDDTLFHLRQLFRRFVQGMLRNGFTTFKVNEPGKYGRLRGSFVFHGEAKTYTYDLTVKLNPIQTSDDRDNNE